MIIKETFNHQILVEKVNVRDMESKMIQVSIMNQTWEIVKVVAGTVGYDVGTYLMTRIQQNPVFVKTGQFLIHGGAVIAKVELEEGELL